MKRSKENYILPDCEEWIGRDKITFEGEERIAIAAKNIEFSFGKIKKGSLVIYDGRNIRIKIGNGDQMGIPYSLWWRLQVYSDQIKEVKWKKIK